MKHVKILKRTHFLNPGEHAGFDDEVADHLVKHGYAELIDFKLPNKKGNKEAEKAAALLAEQKKQAELEAIEAEKKAEEERLAAEAVASKGK